MNYQWYPGHMTKARRMMQENIKLIDLVIELVDARIPISSRNPDIDELGKGKSRIILLNKSDLADPVWNKKWVEYFAAKGMGKEYLAGIKNGFSISRKGYKVPFSMKHLPNYARIQLELWKNIFLRFTA